MANPWLAHYDAGIPATIAYPDLPIHQLLEDSAARYGTHTAVKLVLRYRGAFTFGGVLTYAYLAAEVNRFAAALHALGVRKGDRVALMLPNLPQFVIGFYGAARLGAIIVNTNPTYTGRELAQQFGDAGAETVVLLRNAHAKFKTIQSQTPIQRVIVTDPADYASAPTRRLLDTARPRANCEAEPRAGDGIYDFRALLAAHPEPPPAVAINPDATALFQYTGGTTGIPKAAMLTHRNLVVNTIQFARWITTLEAGRERIMAAIPLFHVYGMTVAMNLAIYSGAALITLPNPRPVDHLMQALQRERVTLFPGVPTMYSGIIQHPKVSQYNLRAIKACISGAAPLPMDVQLKFGEITGGRLVEGYGLTEAAPVTHCNPIYGIRKAGSIGVPFPDVEAKIMNPERLTELPPEEQGELWVRGPQVMQGYWNQPTETANTLTPDGWLRTGDIARMDAHGYFYLVDRLKDVINVSGFKVVPREVEEVLLQYPQVAEAVVVGLPDRRRGEVVKAYVVFWPGEAATVEELSAWCADRLAPYKIPRQIEFRTTLPKTTVGKVLRRVLVEEMQPREGNS